MDTELDTTKALLRFIEQSPTAYHAVRSLKSLLTSYTPLNEAKPWDLQPGGRYYVTRNGSSLLAFRMPVKPIRGFQMAAAHSDCPVFKIKANGEMVVENHYVKLNVEKYGGMLCAPWLDRPLSIAGRVVVREGDALVSRLVDLKRDVALIPNLAIHMNRGVNEGNAYNAQVDMLPLFGGKDTAGTLLPLVAASAGAEPEEILGTDLFLYNRMPGTIWGAENEFVSTRSLDDLQCAWALTQGFLQAEDQEDRVTLCAVFDNEEVGSGTKQGALSTLLEDTIGRIWESTGRSGSALRQVLTNSFLVSADNGHAVHPNHPEKADPTNRPYLNEGVVIKYNANQKYTTDGVSEAVFKTICDRAGVPWQTYCNRSDIPGGSTLGNLANQHVSLNTVDIGLAQLAMHSPYETGGVRDTGYLVRAMQAYFSAAVEARADGVYLVK
ncbi:MAG: M18 family aminopeptidase [Clostridiales bacterium]|nr:M18 family aminopeptidase [Clostridiales bacterium]